MPPEATILQGTDHRTVNGTVHGLEKYFPISHLLS